MCVFVSPFLPPSLLAFVLSCLHPHLSLSLLPPSLCMHPILEPNRVASVVPNKVVNGDDDANGKWRKLLKVVSGIGVDSPMAQRHEHDNAIETWAAPKTHSQSTIADGTLCLSSPSSPAWLLTWPTLSTAVRKITSTRNMVSSVSISTPFPTVNCAQQCK